MMSDQARRFIRESPSSVDRYTVGARINHWITAASLILLALSGLALFHPSLFFLSGLFGGGQFTRFIHPWIGVVLFFGFFGPLPAILEGELVETRGRDVARAHSRRADQS